MSSADCPQRGEQPQSVHIRHTTSLKSSRRGTEGGGRPVSKPGLALDHVLKVKSTKSMVSPSAIINDDALERIYVLASKKRHLKERSEGPLLLRGPVDTFPKW
jgi:hypothetical protein